MTDSPPAEGPITPPIDDDPALPAPAEPGAAAPLYDEPSGDAPIRTAGTSGVVRASSTMAIATLVSRATGFVAKVVILAFLGFSIVNDSYNLANTLPNIVFELLIGGVLTSVAIPLLSRARKDPDGGLRYTQQLMTLMVVGLTAATVLAIAAAPLLTRLYLDDGDNTDLRLATNLAYLLLPQIFFYGLAALFGAILNTGERFAAPAWAPVANNLVVIAVGAILITTSAGSDQGLVSLSRDQFLLLGLGTTAGIVIQAAIMVPALRRSGFRFGWHWGIDGRMRQAGALAGWAIAYVLVSQVGYVVITKITSRTEDGLLSLYYYGSMLFQLPYGILGVSLLTAIMPRMSRHAAAGEMAAVKHDMRVANRLSAVALLPVSAAMIVLALPLAVVTARYGPVGNEDVRILAATLAAFAIGLLPLAITLVQMRVFYAMADGRTPVVINAIMVAVRVPLLLACLWLPIPWVVPGLAAATSVSYLVGVVAGEIWLHARFGRMGFTRTLDAIWRAALASIVGAAAAYLAVGRLDDTFGGSVIALLLGGLVGLVVVGTLMLLLRVDEVTALKDAVLRRLRGGGPQLPADNGADDDDLASPIDRSWDDGRDSTSEESEVTVTDDEVTLPALGAAMSMPGMVVGERYRLTRRICSDASGNEFWQARDTVLSRDMAVTILPATDPTSATVTRTLRVGRLGHPGLPQTLDMGALGHNAYLAGLWVDGATITDLLGDGPLEAPIAQRVISSVAEAVQAVHESGIALGTLHPSLIRVNAEGQVRLSHVISTQGAAPVDDIRAVGALLYFMLTATWPLAPGDGPDDAPPAPRRSGGRAAPAARVVSAVPAALSRLTERALNPQGAGGLTDLTELVNLAAPGGGLAAGSAAHRTRPARADRAAHRGGSAITVSPKVLRDRRIKLSIAGSMLAVMAVLIVITGSAVVKQVLAEVVEPINAADQQRLLSADAPTTTRSVGTTADTPGSEADTDESTRTEGTTGTSTTAEGKPLKIADISVYDPQGDGSKDYESYVDLAIDGDPATGWLTWVYNQQFGPGGIKDGVGVIVKLAKAAAPESVTVTTSTAGTRVEIRSADAANPALGDTEVLGAAKLGDDPVNITLDHAPKSKYLLVWVTELAPYSGDTGENQGKYQSEISEITITG